MVVKLTVALREEGFFYLFLNLLCEIPVVLSTMLRAGAVHEPCECFLHMCGCGYSPCGLPWFQGKVWPIPPISGASLRDILGSLMLSIVGGTKPLSPSASPISPFPHPFTFLSSCHSSRPFLLTHISTSGYLGLHWLMDCSLLPNSLGCGPLRHVIWGTSWNASTHSSHCVTRGGNTRVMNNYPSQAAFFAFIALIFLFVSKYDFWDVEQSTNERQLKCIQFYATFNHFGALSSSCKFGILLLLLFVLSSCIVHYLFLHLLMHVQNVSLALQWSLANTTVFMSKAVLLWIIHDPHINSTSTAPSDSKATIIAWPWHDVCLYRSSEHHQEWVSLWVPNPLFLRLRI